MHLEQVDSTTVASSNLVLPIGNPEPYDPCGFNWIHHGFSASPLALVSWRWRQGCQIHSYSNFSTPTTDLRQSNLTRSQNRTQRIQTMKILSLYRSMATSFGGDVYRTEELLSKPINTSHRPHAGETGSEKTSSKQ